MTGKIFLSEKFNIHELSPSAALLLGIIFCAEEKTKNFGSLIGNVELNQDDISTLINVSRQSVSRYLYELENSALIKYEKGGKIFLSESFYFNGAIDLGAVKNFTQLSTCIQVLFVIINDVAGNKGSEGGSDASNYTGAGLLKEREVAELLRGISKQAVASHLRALVRAGLIKYKYSGRYFVNPDFFYAGTGEETDLNAVRENYKKFKSDM